MAATAEIESATSATHPTSTRPWGAGRLAPYPTTLRRSYATVTVDPATQLGVFRDHAGQVVEGRCVPCREPSTWITCERCTGAAPSGPTSRT
ncbi:putative ATP-grasp-modified RiPP [Streptomyces nigrescens]|uniref:putative ATP-grasp-modified RiPP n=1 Tax=Streptomyces nigrescens TaxID=1920 RepID=UPI0021C35D37|nr:putative ATP-grasp-modified RiPP [Streptomyces nigrescens]